MAHVKALNKAKNKSMDDGPESPHHTPITGRGRNGDSDDDDPVREVHISVRDLANRHSFVTLDRFEL